MNGLIAYFDILGYQNFLKNNSAEASVSDVLDILNNLPNMIKEFSQKQITQISQFEGVEDNVKELFSSFHNTLDHLVFSDTIVLTLQLPYKNSKLLMDPRSFMIGISYMAVCAAYLFERMHFNGLPVRGVIHEGEYFKKEYCLAGLGIVEAYQSCESINLSGLVCSKSLSKKVLDIYKNKNGNAINNNSGVMFLFTHQTPHKDGSEVSLVHINWLEAVVFDDENMQRYMECRKDVDNYVWQSFWAHQKDCPSSVDLKVQNTIKLIRKMIYNIDNSEKMKSLKV